MSRFTHPDKAIIECLNRDSRASSAEIARELETAERTVRYRIHDFLTHKLHRIPGMHRTRTVLVPRIIKSISQWLPP